MRILICLTYYRPHYSGLTIYTERLAVALAKSGHKVIVLTSRFDRSLPEREIRDGVEVIRPDVAFRISKGVVMPEFPLWALRLLRQADVINLHVPQLDASYVALFSRLAKKPVVLTYHCDLQLPQGAVHWLANQVSTFANYISANSASALVTNTRDYAVNSPFLQHYLNKVKIIKTPVETASVSQSDIQAFRQKFDIHPEDKIIGMVARLATEKGVEYLVGALPAILKKYPNSRVLFVGPYQNVVGEDAYANRLMPLIDGLGNRWTFLGVVTPVELAAFYKESVVTVLPSINGTESFGIVQVESMIAGTPVVASDIPGVRCPVRETGMGLIVPPRDSAALAKAIIAILDNPEAYKGNSEQIQQQYSSTAIAYHYEALFKELIQSHE